MTGLSGSQVFEKVISAVGVVPNSENLGLEKLRVETSTAGITTSGAGKKSVAGIYAIGDVAGAPMLAHKAEHEAVHCVAAIASGIDHGIDKAHILGCTFCQPQVASIGLSEQSAKDAGYAIRVGRFPFIANGKAVALDEAAGLVKTIFDAVTGKLLGAHLVNPEVTELIQGFATAIGH